VPSAGHAQSLGAHRGDVDGDRRATGNRDRPRGVRRELVAVEVNSPLVEHRPQNGQVLTKARDGVGPRGAERLAFRLVGTQPEAEAEIAVRGGLRRLRQ
jgi:hypothetical protein